MNCRTCGAPARFNGLMLVCPNGHGVVSSSTGGAEQPPLPSAKMDSLFSEPVFRDESLITARCDICGKQIEIQSFEYYNKLAVCRMYICDECQMERLKKTLPQWFRE